MVYASVGPPFWRHWGAISLLGLMISLSVEGSSAQANDPPTRRRQLAVAVDRLHVLHVTTAGRIIENSTRQVQGGECPQEVSSHTDADFGGGVFIMQAGFAENEIAATSYVLDAGDFPLRVDTMEMIFATLGATVTTTTEWSVLVWEGTPDDGNLVASFSSDGELLPHIVLPPGTNGVNVVVSVDPGAPEQIIVGDNGTHTFSIGYRIDQHNNQTGSGCSSGDLPTCCNAFPTVDTSGVASLTGNWLFGINCGLFGCPSNGGWANFQALPGGPGQLCTPSGDWVMRATWTPTNCGGGEPGACCLDDGGCFDVTLGDCAILEGAFEGDGTICADVECPLPTEACCFEVEPEPFCLDLALSDCGNAGGFAQGVGSSCVQTECFATGACCLPDGSCLDDQFQQDCQSFEGLYQGTGSLCEDAECPQPEGACCFDTGFCLPLTETDCSSVGAAWAGPLTDCEDSDANGTADACESPCPADFNGDWMVDPVDLAFLLGAWGDNPGSPADLNGDGVVGPIDLASVLGAWGPCP